MNKKTKIFIDGKEGTTGLRIYDRLASMENIELIVLSEEDRKNTEKRKEAINASDVSFLCLPDQAAIEAAELVENNNTVLKTISQKLSSVNAFMYTVFLVRLVCSAVNIYLLPSAPVWILALLFVIAAMYCVFLGIQTIGRSAEIIFIFVLISLITSVIFCTTDFVEGLKTKSIFDLNKSYADMRTVFLFGSPVILYNLISCTDEPP